jgi:hypothetical protein
MYKQRNTYRDGRDNSRNGYTSQDYNRGRGPYRGSWRDDSDRYEDDRYHSSNYGRREDDYGPFSNIYDNDSRQRGDFDTRYNEKDNYYYDRGPQNNRSDEARGQSLSDVFSGGRRRGKSDREYFTSYRSGDENRYGSDPYYSLYGSEDSARYNRKYYSGDYRNEYGPDEDRYESRNEWRDSDRYGDRGDYYRDENEYRNLRDYSDRDRSYSGDSTAFNKRRRYNEGYLY